MRWLSLIPFVAMGCSFDWSESKSGTGGTTGTGATGATGTGATGVGATGTGATSTGATGGGVTTGGGGEGGSGGDPAGGGGVAGAPIVACGDEACLGKACDVPAPCGASGATMPCCAVSQDCASPVSTTVDNKHCVPKGCFDGTRVICNAACPDLCSAFKQTCCPDGFCKDSCT